MELSERITEVAESDKFRLFALTGEFSKLLVFRSSGSISDNAAPMSRLLLRLLRIKLRSYS